MELWGWTSSGDALSKGSKGGKTFIDTKEVGVGDGIRGTGQKVSQADLRTNRRGQNPKSQVERARDIAQQRRENLVRAVLHGLGPARSLGGCAEMTAPSLELGGHHSRSGCARDRPSRKRALQVEHLQ